MDKATLEKDDILEGKNLIKHLENTDFEVDSALWLYFSGAEEWRLVLASSYVDLNGPNKSYGYIQNELDNINPKIGISLTDISAIGTKDELIKLLKNAMTTNNTLNEIRLQHVISGVWIDALVYKI